MKSLRLFSILTLFAGLIFSDFSSASASEIAVEQPFGTDLASGSTKDFGSSTVGVAVPLTFMIKNTGSDNLTGLTITKSGTHAADFTVTSNPVAPVSGPSGSTTFTVQFTASAIGSRTATIQIANNDSDENPFNINLVGTGLAQEVSDFTYQIALNAVTITGYTGSGVVITIPSTLSGLPVVAIGNSAFSNQTSLTGITIPSSVTTIGSGNFSNSKLTAIVVDANNPNYSSLDGVFFDKSRTTLIRFPIRKAGSYVVPATVTSIENFAFGGCNGLTSVTLPSSLTNIESKPFYNCALLTEIIVDAENPNYSSLDGVLFNKLRTTLIKFPQRKSGDYVVPTSVINIGYQSFFSCTYLTNVTLSFVSTIEDSAFFGCRLLTNVTIPSSVTSIGKMVFTYCDLLTDIVVNAANPNYSSLDGVLFDKLRTTLIEVPEGKAGDYVVPASTSSIQEYAFDHSSGLTSVTIPSSVTSIGSYAFQQCSNLRAAFFAGNSPTMGILVFRATATGFTVYCVGGASGFISPTWQGYPCFIAAPYGGLIPNSSINEAHLIGGAPADGNVKLEATVTSAPLVWQRQTTPVTLDMESSCVLRLGATGTVRIQTGYGSLAIGTSVGDGFLTAGGVANTAGTLVLDNASTNDLTINAVISNNGSGVVGLSKTSSGRAVLVSMNTYAGNTTISGGTLVLKSPCMADASAVTIASGSTLNLDYTGADIVSSLTISGAAQPNGCYDSTNTSGRITGTGKIQVGPFANFAAWASANSPGQTGNQDHDNDGVPNGVEYFMGATGNGITQNPGIALDGTVIWPKGAGFVGSYAVEVSTDLMEWTDVSNDPAQVTHYSDSIIWTRPTGAGNRFVRLAVMSN